MKRVETININGIVFNIDDDAYGKLAAYLDVLGKNFENEQGGRDIIADIEARISELFAERDGGISRVVTTADVMKVIETLGTPEDIVGIEEADNAPPPRTSQKATKPLKRLYRDPDRRYIGGVCSGIAAWLDISPLVVRLLFIVFTLLWGVALGVYFLLWIIMPKAKTTAQKLEMRGEAVTISNIEKNIKESFSDPLLKQSVRDFQNEAGEVFTKFFGLFGRIIGILLGLFLLLWGIALVIGATSLITMQDIIFKSKVEWDFLSFTQLLSHIISPTAYAILLICAITAASLFIFAFLFWGAKLITGFKVRHKLLHVALAVVWITAIVTGIIACISQVRNFAWNNEQMVETIHIAPLDTFYIAFARHNLQLSNNPMDIYFDKDNKRFYGKANLNIQKSNDGQSKINIRRESQGESKLAAYRYAEDIEYSVEIRDSLLNFDRFFTVIPQDKWKFQRLNATLFVPEGTVIIFDKSTFQDRIRPGVRRQWNADHPWIMTENRGLQRVDIP